MSDKIINYKGEDVLKAVHKINFGKGGILDISGGTPDIEEELSKYKNGTFSDANYCKECDGINLVRKDNNQKYWFTNMTNGAHILDYINAYNSNEKHKSISVEGWSDCPIIFVMENPSVNYKDDNGIDLYNQDWDNFHNKKFTPNRWYWAVGRYDKMSKYPENFEQKAYSGLFLSIANTFKLKNAYLTNMVKCGVGCMSVDNKEEYVVTSDYNQDIVKKCILLRLKEEIDALRRKENEDVIVFAFGDNAYYYIRQELKDNHITVYKLPHPANRLSNDYRKYVLLGKICQALLKADIDFNENEVKKLLKDEDIEKESEPVDVNTIEEKITILQNELDRGDFGNWEMKDGYANGAKRYCRSGKSKIIFKFKQKEFLEDGVSHVIWIRYDFVDNSYIVFTGEGRSANNEVETDFDRYDFYIKVKEIIDNVIKAE